MTEFPFWHVGERGFVRHLIVADSMRKTYVTLCGKHLWRSPGNRRDFVEARCPRCEAKLLKAERRTVKND